MENHNLKPIQINFKDVRKNRQQTNNEIVYHSIKKNDIKTFNESINIKEFERTLIDLKYTKEECLKKGIEDDAFCTILSRLISKKASRQGNKDEILQLKACNMTSQHYEITITNLSATDLRPTKDGQIISKKEMLKKSIPMDCCLKSFDGKITGKMSGYITAKVSYGSGGHQDNVFEEMDTIAEWWKTHKCNTDEILVILIDTDLTTKFIRLKEKYNNEINIMVFNHIDLQNYIITNY